MFAEINCSFLMLPEPGAQMITVIGVAILVKEYVHLLCIVPHSQTLIRPLEVLHGNILFVKN